MVGVLLPQGLLGAAQQQPVLGAGSPQPMLGGWQPGTTPQWVPDWLRNLSNRVTTGTQASMQNISNLTQRIPGAGPMTPEDFNVLMSLGTAGSTLGEHPSVSGYVGDAPKDEGAYLNTEDLNRAQRATYFDEGKKLASSRDVPQTAPQPLIGSWRMSGTKLNYGRDIEQLTHLDPSQIEISEDTGAQKWPDVEHYAQWMQEGKEPPPIEVLQQDTGRLKVTDGHRRLVAAKLAGQPTIPAWVSWTVKNDKGNPTGLTYELAQKGAEPVPLQAPRPDRLMFEDDLRRFKQTQQAQGLLGGASEASATGLTVSSDVPKLQNPQNPYQNPLMRQAWDNGNNAAGKRYANRASNPHFDQSMSQAWNDGFDARMVAKAAKRAAK